MPGSIQEVQVDSRHGWGAVSTLFAWGLVSGMFVCFGEPEFPWEYGLGFYACWVGGG